MNDNDYNKDFNSGNIVINDNPNTNQVNYKQVEAKSPNLNVVEPQPNNSQPQPKKKNRTLQYYKFLLYAMKIEIKMHEFIDLIRFSNQSEISLWILSVVLYFKSPENYSNLFVWIHVIHIIRGLIGFLLMIKLPRSYKLVEAMEVSNKEMETKLFNDIAREVINKEVVVKLQGMKGWMITYFALTFINFVFDLIDFFYCLSNIDKTGQPNNVKIILLTYLAMSFLYLGINYL